MTRPARRGLTAALALTLILAGSLTALAGGEAGQDYCKYKPWKCSTTTTVPDTTTTTEPEATTTVPETTTVPDTTTTEPTTTTVPDTTTTEPETTMTEPLTPATWTAEAFCDVLTADRNGAIRVDFDPAEIERVDATWTDPVFGANPVDSFTEPGWKRAEVGGPSDFVLVAIARPGFVAVPEAITVTVEVCPAAAPTVVTTTPTAEASTTTIATPPDTLPFTGPSAGVGLAALAAALVGGGLALTMLRRDGE